MAARRRPSPPGPPPKPEGGRRATRRAARADEFLDAALKIVARDGIDGLTIAGLAADVGAATGALYRYFPGKDDLLAALQVRALDALAAELGAAREEKKRAALSRLVEVIGVMTSLPERDPPRFRLLDELLSAPSPVYAVDRARVLEAQLQRVLTTVAHAIDDAADDGALERGDTAVRTRILWALVHGASHLKKRDRLEPPALRHRVVERAAVEAVLVGFGASRAAARAAVRAALP